MIHLTLAPFINEWTAILYNEWVHILQIQRGYHQGRHATLYHNTFNLGTGECVNIYMHVVKRSTGHCLLVNSPRNLWEAHIGSLCQNLANQPSGERGGSNRWMDARMAVVNKAQSKYISTNMYWMLVEYFLELPFAHLFLCTGRRRRRAVVSWWWATTRKWKCYAVSINYHLTCFHCSSAALKPFLCWLDWLPQGNRFQGNER